MIKLLTLLLLILFTNNCLAEDAPVGFLWYNLPVKNPVAKKEKPKPGRPFKQLSYTARDAVLRYHTMEALHRARNTKSMQDMRLFLALQDYWLKESSQFSQLFKKTLLYYPEYDYTVTHPVSNLGTKLVDATRETNRKALISKLGKTHGLLFFYRAKNRYDQQQIPIIRDFCKRFKLALIPFAVDGERSELLANSRLDKGEAQALGVRFFPAVLVVNPKTKKTLPVAYGLTTQDTLEQRLSFVATQFRGEAL